MKSFLPWLIEEENPRVSEAKPCAAGASNLENQLDLLVGIKKLLVDQDECETLWFGLSLCAHYPDGPAGLRSGMKHSESFIKCRLSQKEHTRYEKGRMGWYSVLLMGHG